MAGGASARAYRGMTKRGAGEARVVLMASIARSGGDNVRRCFAQCIPLRIGTVVTGGALTGNDALGSGVSETIYFST